MTKPRKARKAKHTKEELSERGLDEIMGALLKVPKIKRRKTKQKESANEGTIPTGT